MECPTKVINTSNHFDKINSLYDMVFKRYKGPITKKKIEPIERNIKTPIIFKYSFLIPDKNYSAFKSKNLDSFDSKIQISPILFKSRKHSSFKDDLAFKLHLNNSKHINIQEEKPINNKIPNIEQKGCYFKSEEPISNYSSKNILYKVDPEKIRNIYKRLKLPIKELKDVKNTSLKFKNTILLYKNAINSLKLSKTSSKQTFTYHDSSNNFNQITYGKNTTENLIHLKNNSQYKLFEKYYLVYTIEKDLIKK